MANNPKISNTGVNSEVNAICALLNNGYLRIYDGTQPADADTPVTTQNLLAELRFNATAFGSSAAGVATANAFTNDSDANATGTAGWFRALESDGTTVIFDGSVGTSGCDLNIDSVSIVQHVEVDVTGFSFTASKG